jgi:hypothetical protein
VGKNHRAPRSSSGPTRLSRTCHPISSTNLALLRREQGAGTGKGTEIRGWQDREAAEAAVRAAQQRAAGSATDAATPSTPARASGEVPDRFASAALRLVPTSGFDAGVTERTWGRLPVRWMGVAAGGPAINRRQGAANGGPYRPSLSRRCLTRAAAVLSADLAALADLTEAGDRAELAELRHRLTDGVLRVLVVGEAKRGKSTLVNALLGRPVLPTGVLPLTAIATTLAYGDADEVAVRYADGRVEELGLGGLEMVTEEGITSRSTRDRPPGAPRRAGRRQRAARHRGLRRLDSSHIHTALAAQPGRRPPARASHHHCRRGGTDPEVPAAAR